MYLKIIGSLFLLTSTASIGYLKAENLNQRVKLLKEFKHMMICLQGELRFHRAVLWEAFENVSKRVGNPFAAFLEEISCRLDSKEYESFELLWEETSRPLLRKEGFAKEDRQLFEMLGASLGYLDITMQSDSLNLVILQTDEHIERAKEQFQKTGKLYQTMGITMGAFLVLLII